MSENSGVDSYRPTTDWQDPHKINSISALGVRQVSGGTSKLTLCFIGSESMDRLGERGHLGDLLMLRSFVSGLCLLFEVFNTT